MAITQTLKSQSPYFDDFDPDKDFIQVLFRPGYPVQARELTTLQTFLQYQISRFGDSTYRNATIVKNAELTHDTDVIQLALTGSGNTIFPASGALNTASLGVIDNFVGKIITNSTGTVKARVLKSPTGTIGTSSVGNLYIKYLTEETFAATGGYIYALRTDNVELTADYYNTYSASASARIVSIDDGIFYFNGRFIRCGSQSIVVPIDTFNVGFNVEEKVVTPYEDATLFDNARGSTNEGAPGAHRQVFSLTLQYKEMDAISDQNFYRIATYINGVRQQVPEIDHNLEMINEILARRTSDESGDYTVRPFTSTVDVGDSEGNFEITVSPSKAYVKGYEIVKASPTKIYLDRLSAEKTTKNHKVPVVGTTALQVTGVTGSLPGSTTGQPFTAANRLQLKNGAGNTIGIARAWAIKDVFQKGQALTKLFFYDLRMFTVLDVDSAGFKASLVNGNDIVSLKTKAQVFNDEGQAGLTGFTVVGSNGKFRNGRAVSSNVLDSEVTLTSVTEFDISQVASITAANGFSATVTANTVENENSTLFVETAKEIKTMKDGSTSIMDNDFEVLENKGSTATTLNAANGFYDLARVNDQAEIKKVLKFAYLNIHNGTGVNYGWSSKHKEISLYHSDVYKVYKINESTDGSFDNGRFSRINITTTGVLPQGSIITGETSGTKAIVALTNSSSIDETRITGTNFHAKRVGTGSASQLEVIFTEGTAFTANENITVAVPGSENAYTYSIVYNSVTASIGKDATGSYQLDDGQRNEYYDVGRLVRNENVPAPNNNLVVFFSYFESDPTTNHYYSADSWEDENFYRVDPRFIGTVRQIKPVTSQVGKNLRNGFDFRLKVKPITNTAYSPFNFSAREFESQDRVVPGSVMTTDIVEYLGRVDLISLEKTGDMIVIPGVASDKPQKPQKSVDGMGLYWVHVPPVVRYPETDLFLEKIENRRYTMRDIGDLERRIDVVEANVALNMLELQALNDENGGRTKSGFVTANFTKEKNDPTFVGDTAHPEYNASVDIVERALIPAQTDGVPIEMNVSGTANISTFFDGYYLKAFTEEAFSTQLDATTSQKINPFATWVFQGDVTIKPAEDHWRIRKDDYFTELYGELKPFSGSAADFDNFNKITTRSPGGKSTTVTEWIGQPKVNKTSSAPHTVPDMSGSPFGVGTLRQKNTVTVTQAQRSTTTTVFDKPRSTGQVTTTLSGTEVIENPQDYFMRSLTITYSAENLKPTTSHNINFGGKTLATVTSTVSGTLNGTFTIPAQTFKAGTQTVEIVDASNAGNSFGYTSFTSIGHLDTFKTVAKTATSVVNKSTKENVEKSKRTWFTDPIAQMFMLPNVGAGDITKEVSIITSLDLWFSYVDLKPTMDKVKVEIRESVNGYPGGPDKILGESAYITVTSANQTSSISDSTATNIKFKEPVVLRGGVEYAIVVKSPSSDMAVYVAEMGEQKIDGTGIHSSQPNVGGYFGSFFKSQNSSTWTADQSKDMTYRLYRAKFDSADSTVTLTNKIQDTGYFKGDIGAFNQGLAMETFAGADYVRVFHPNHGMHYTNAQVTISGVESGTYNGITDSELNGTFAVKYATLDSYIIKTTGRATASGKINTGQFTTFATQDVMYDSILTNFMPTKEENDEVLMSVKTRVTSPVKLVVSNNKIANESIAVPYADTVTQYQIDREIEFDEPRIVRSQTNSGGDDLTITLTMKNGSTYTSPILKANSNLNPIAFRNITGYMLTDSDIEGLTRTTLTDSDDDVQQEYMSYVQAVKSEEEHSAFVTKQIDLEIPGDGFTVKFDADMEPQTSIEAAYKIRALGDDVPFEELEWIDFPYAQQITENNYGDFSSDPTETSYTMRADTNFDFSSFKLRLRMRVENEAKIPKLKRLRIIADV